MKQLGIIQFFWLEEFCHWNIVNFMQTGFICSSNELNVYTPCLFIECLKLSPPWWDHVNHFVWIISDVQQKEILLPTLWAIFYHSFFNFLDFVAIELSGELSLGYYSQITFRRRKTLSFKQNYIEKCLIF